MIKRHIDAGTGTLIFNTVTGKLAIDCPSTPCDRCTNTPRYFKAVFSGSLADQDCDACENIPTTYVAEQFSECLWRIDLCNCNTRSPIVLTSAVRITMNLIGSDYILRCLVSIIRRTPSSTNAGTDEARFEKNFGTTKPDCKAFSNEVLTFQGMDIDGDVCGDWSALSVTITTDPGPADNDDRQCGYCTWQTQPDEYTVEISGGLTDGNCDCTDLGGAVTVDKFNVAGDDCCDWRGTYVGDCAWSYHLELRDGVAEVSLVGPGDSVIYRNSGLSQPHDCGSSVSCGHISQTSTINCSVYSGTTAEVVAV
jgi:hypothetical protein